MKKTLLIIFLLFVVKFQAQEDKGFLFDVSGGITAPLGDYKTYTKTFAENGMGFIGFTEEITGKAQFGFGASYQFGAFGAGFNIGIFKHEISSLTYEIDFPILLQGGEIDGIFYGIGPDYMTSFGDFSFSALLRGGLMDVSLDKFTGSYNGADATQPIEILSTELAPGSKTSLPYTSLGVKFSYPIYQGLSVFVKGEYLTTFGDGIEILDTYYTPFDADNDGFIGIDDVNQFVNIEYLEEDLRFLKPQMLNFSLGFSYSFGEGPNKTGETENPSDNLKAEKEKTKTQKGVKTIIDKGKISAEFTNPAKEKADKEKKKRKLVAVTPKNNSHFESSDEIKNFTWELIGDQIENPSYIIEVTRIGSNRESQRIYVGKSVKTSINEVIIFNNEKLDEGQYKWNVIETTTELVSNTNFFSITSTPCHLDFKIINESIECLGYEGENRKFKICFDSKYLSSSGNLMFTQPGTGLKVYDQTSASLSYTLVSPNPFLLTQIGTSSTPIVSYCFEIIVSNSVTQISFGLQGDDIDPSNFTCIPGASANFDDLPDCLCDDCEDVELSFDNFNIALNQPYGNQFDFNGNLNVSVPIYGIEFQIMSYS